VRFRYMLNCDHGVFVKVEAAGGIVALSVGSVT
jgi:hypothetical protein